MGTVKDKITVTKQTPLHTKDWYIKWGRKNYGKLNPQIACRKRLLLPNTETENE